MVTITMTGTGTAAGPVAVTQGVAGQDFAITGAGTCTDGLVVSSAGQQCTAYVVFSPKYPGIRPGAVLVKTSAGALLGSALVSGIGTGSLAVLDPGVISTVVGDSEWFYAGDGVAATQAPVHEPAAAVTDAAGNLYVSDSENYRVRRVDAQTQTITTIAGTGSPGYSGDGGAATQAAISTPGGIAIDGAGNIYFADTGNHVVREIGIDGIIRKVAGTAQTQGYSGDGGAAIASKLSLPEGVALDASGNLYIADTGNGVIRKVNAADGTISTVAGVAGSQGYNGDGAATSSKLNSPWSIVVAADNSIYIADTYNNRIRRLAGGALSTVVGSGAQGYGGDDGPAASATLNLPLGVALDPAGDLYIADSANDRIRKVSAGTGSVSAGTATIETIVGTGGEGFSGDGAAANLAALHGPYAVFFAQNGDLYIADTINNRIRAVPAASITLPPFPDTKVTKTSSPPVDVGLDSDGNADLNLSSATLVNAALDSTATTCSFTSVTAMGTSCNLGVEFAPTTVQSNLQGSVTVHSDAANTPATIDLSGNGLDVNPTTMTLRSNTNPSVVGQPVTFTATVANDGSSPLTGPVTFLDGANALCSNVSLSGGNAICSTSALALGQHTITANYAGDSNNESNTASLTQTVKQQATLTLAVNPSPNATVLQNIALTLTVAAPSGTPTGTVVFYDGNTAISSALALSSSGVASLSTASLAPGQHSLTAQYSGDATNAAGSSAAVSETVSQSATTTTLSTTNANPTVGDSVTFTATVSSADGATPGGTVSFTDNGSPLGAASLNGSAVASITLSSLSPGNHSIVGHYNGDTDDAVSSSSPLAEIVAQIVTVTMLSSDANPLSAGATLHLTATVSLSPGAVADGALAGTVTFTDGNTAVGSATLDSSGQATLALSSLSVGNHTLVASYAGTTNYAASSSAALTQQVQKTATAVTVTASSTNALTGEPVTFTATVTSQTGIATGTVTLYDNGTALQTAGLNSQGMASFSISTLATGSHSITVGYSGDANYSAGTSATTTETISLAQPSITLSGPSTAVDAGATVVLSGDFSSSGVHPTGVLTLRDGLNTIASQPIPSAGAYTFSTSSLALGTHSLSVYYAGDSNNASATSPTVQVTIQQAPTATALGVGSNPGTFGQPVTFTANVVSSDPGLTGSVTFFDGNTSIGSVSLSSTGSASLTTSALDFGVHSITAAYAGDTQHAASTSVAVNERIVEPATATLTSSLNPAVSGLDVALVANVIAQGTEVPTGNATFRDNGNVLGSVALDGSGSATLHTSSLSVGSHVITFSYAGDTNVAAVSASLTQIVQSATTQVTLIANPSLVAYASPLVLSATVISNGGAATGTVTFTENGALLGSATLNAQGIASLTLTSLPPGDHTIIANYAGDGKAAASVSAPVTVAVKQTTSLTVTSNANPTMTVSPITLVAALTNSGAAAASGTIVFSDGTTQLGTATLDGSGHASLALPSLPSGTHAITASYAGDGYDFSCVSAPLMQVVNVRPTTTTVTGSSTDAANPQQITLIAVVHGDGAGTPTGTVNFMSGSLSIGSAVVDDTGVATLTILLQASSGTESVTAVYSGDAVYGSSSSASTDVTAGPATQFTLAIDRSAISVVSKQHTTIVLTLASIKGFNDTIQLGCLGLPFAATCTFSSPQVKLAADGTATADLVVDTGDPLGIGAQASGRRPQLPTAPLWCVLPAALLAGFSGGHRRRLRALLLALVCIVMLGAVSGCAGLQGSGTPPGSYTFKVTASGQGSGATQSQVVTLTVTQ